MPRPARRNPDPRRPSRAARPGGGPAKAKSHARPGPGPAGRPRGPWRHGPVPVVGLVGGIGAGKSTVAAELAARGAAVLDADAIGHALLDQPPAREQVVGRFGPGVLDPADLEKVDRRSLGALVFADRAALRDLEGILHPRMRRTFEKAIARLQRRRTARAIVLDAAVLFEAGWNDLCDLVAFVDAPPEARADRVARSRGWTAETLAAREAAQLDLSTKRGRSQLVVPNDGDEARRDAALDELWTRLRIRPRARTGPRPGRDGDPPAEGPASSTS